jgi:hypothetical protein
MSQPSMLITFIREFLLKYPRAFLLLFGTLFDGVETPICPSWYNNNTKLYR